MSPNPASNDARSATEFSRQTTRTDESERRQQTKTMTQGLEGLSPDLKQQQVRELLCQALETEIGGVQIYETAIRCAQNEDLKQEWNKYLEETRNHEQVLRGCFEKFDLDPETETPGRGIVRANAEALVAAMETALDADDPNLAQIVAAECVVLAETKDHMNWELIGEIAKNAEGEAGTALQEAYEEIEEQEDEHLYHTRGWARELWLESFGLPAVMPPPEEERDVKTEVGAARAKSARTRMVAGQKGGRAKGGRGKAKGRTKATRGKSVKSRGRNR